MAKSISKPFAYIILIINMALWGGALVVSRGVYEDIPPLALTFFRWCSALIILFPFVTNNLLRIKSYFNLPSTLIIAIIFVAEIFCISSDKTISSII